MSLLTYAVVTPARDAATHLPHLALSLRAQSVRAETWVIVESGSRDDTAATACELADSDPRIEVCSVGRNGLPTRGATIVSAFRTGLAVIAQSPPDIVVKVDADVTLPPAYFERLLRAFVRDPLLGIASGSCWELTDGVWERRPGPEVGVWGACRAYRWPCLREVSPIEARRGWREIDTLKANANGWRTATLPELPFRHHGNHGTRRPSRFSEWLARGDAAHYVGSGPVSIAARAATSSIREPAALGLACGYTAAALRRLPQHSDSHVSSLSLRPVGTHEPEWKPLENGRSHA